MQLVRDGLKAPAHATPTRTDALTKESLGVYCERYRTALLRRMSGRLDVDEAEDVVQEIFLRALRDIGRYDPDRSAPQTWLARIGEQTLAQHFRRLYQRERTNQAAAAAEEAVEALSAEERVDLRRMLQTLTPLNCRMVTARFLLGDSLTMIAAQTGIGEDGVRKRIKRSLAVLLSQAAEQ